MIPKSIILSISSRVIFCIVIFIISVSIVQAEDIKVESFDTNSNGEI